MYNLIVLFLLITTSIYADSPQHISKKSWHPLSVSKSSILTNSLININQADIKMLKTLKGIGFKKAQAIIYYRETHHGFSKIEDLKLIKGINGKIFNKIKKKITL